MAEMSLQQAFGLAVQHHNSGRLQEAESLYRQILAVQPNHADALHLLGVVHRKSGNLDSAIALIRRALGINPSCPNANFNLGNALRDHGQVDEAMAAYRQSIALRQNLPQAWHNLGCLLREKGQLDEARAAFAQADAASAVSRSVAGSKRDLALDWYNQGNALREQRRFAEAMSAYQKAVAIRPDFVEAHCNLGNALLELRQLDAAIATYQVAIRLNPNLPQAHFNLGKALYDQGKLDEAMEANRRAIALGPDYSAARCNLASNLFEAGRLDESIAAYQQAIGDDVALNAKSESNLIYVLHFHPDYNAEFIASETRRWNRQYAEPLAGSILPHANDRNPDRRLRIGYVSPDFCSHVVGGNLLPLFRHHNRERFEIVCYSDAARPDTITKWFQQHANIWRDTIALSNEELASQIRADRIDILVDLSLHTAESRLLTFARKPAPVQVSFAGYPGSTGLTTIDYRLSDPYLDPPGAEDSLHGGQTIRLPHSFWCYQPAGEPYDFDDIPVAPLPALASGNITFGCLNNFCKINNVILDLWAKVLQQLPDSRLLLLAKHGSHRQRTVDDLGKHNIPPHRIEFVSYGPRPSYLKQYHRIDIGLDSFPYNGHTTSLDSLWMGVPVVTLVGQIPVARAGLCQLSNLDLTELAAHTPEEFVRLAVDLANDLPRLQKLRATLRTRMEQSPLMDAAAFAADIESAYRQMWRRWCILH
jgi:predicted O-linked N-acetylglucosamine transferase (SPINDLY family)